MKSINPYTNPLPVSNIHKLFGRDQLIADIIDRLSNNSHFIELIGLSRSGKTSLLNVLYSFNSENNDPLVKSLGFDRVLWQKTIFVLVNFEKLSLYTAYHFWNLLIKQLYEALGKHGLPAVGREGFGSETFANFQDHIEMILDQLSPEGVRLIFLFDEFDIVAKHMDSQILSNLRVMLVDFQREVSFVTATQKHLFEYHAARPLDMQPKSPLHSYIDPSGTIYIGPLEYAAKTRNIVNYIKEPASEHGVTFDNLEIDFALSRGGYHPDLTRITCFHLFQEKVEKNSRKLDHSALASRILNSGLPVLSAIWQSLSSDDQYNIAQIISGEDKDSKDSFPVSDSITRLLNLGVLRSTRQGYQLFSPLFKEFIATQDAELPTKHFEQRQGKSAASSDLIIWSDQNVIQINGKLLHLRPNEMSILEYLINNSGKICTASDISTATGISESAIQSTMSRLRKKVEYDKDEPGLIKTIFGEGYTYENKYEAQFMP